jgi:hypothetical protein
VQVTNLDFTDEEITALTDTDFFIIKDRVLTKIISFFGLLEEDLKKKFPEFEIGVNGLISSGGKVFRGENYKLHPYVVLDCPRLFSSQSVFAFRTMFWWSHEFSFTLHLQGEALEDKRDILLENIEGLFNKNVFWCVNNTPWQYNFDTENYQPIELISDLKEIILSKPFIKLSRKLKIEENRKASDYCLETFKLFMGTLK